MEQKLVEIPLSQISPEELKFYVINKVKDTAIKIPDSVIEVFNKFKNPNDPRSLLSSDIITIGLAYQNYYKLLKQIKERVGFTESENKLLVTGSGARKFIFSSLTSTVLDEYFETVEVADLLNFFSDCPEGYEFVEKPFWAHSELPHVKYL